MANSIKNVSTDRIPTSQSNSQLKMHQDGQIFLPSQFHSSPAFPPPTAQLPPLPSASRDPPLSPLYGKTAQSMPGMAQFPSLSKKRSEASRLRTFNQGYQRSHSNYRLTSEISETKTDHVVGFTPSSIKGLRKEINAHKALPELLPRSEDNSKIGSHRFPDRASSFNSSQPAMHQLSASLRYNSSMPGAQKLDMNYAKAHVPNSSILKPYKELGQSKYNQSCESSYSAKHDPILPGTEGEEEEVRSSFRSAITTNSSYLETNGTERSSVLTKRSSRTSIFIRDEGMSVDDAIEMYEQGFPDSCSDKNSILQPNIRRLEKNENAELEASSKGTAQPQSDPIEIATIKTQGQGNWGSSKTQELPSAMNQGIFAQDSSASRPISRSASAQFDNTRDRYGFKKKTQYHTLEEYEAWNEPYVTYLARRKKKWIALMKQYDLPTTSPQRFPPKSDKVKRFVRKGIPPSWRGAAWFYYAGGQEIVARNPGVYDDLVRRASAGEVTETDDEIIERDLNRTFPDNVKFKPDEDSSSSPDTETFETPILKSLRRVLQAFSIYHPKIGYCQSLNFLAGLLLLFMPEENSFWMLNIITRIFLPGTHSVTLEGANVDLGVLMSSVREMMPSIWAKIGNELDGQPAPPSADNSMRLPPVTLCTTAWFMSCFIGTLPIESTLRVWDSFFYEGSKTLFRIALTIFKLGEPQIRAVHDPMEIFQVVQGIPRGMMDCNRLMEACFKRRGGFVKLSQNDIERGRAERRRGYAEERERLATGGTSTTPTYGTTITKTTTRKGGTFFARGKKERMRLPVQV